MRHDLAHDFADHEGAALVVGGSGGIGLAIARMLAQRGSAVALTYRSRPEAGEAASAAAREWGVRARAWQLDVTSDSASADVVDAVAEDFGGLHTLVYAAGPHVAMKHLSLVSPAQMAAQLAADAAGFFNVVHPALPVLRRDGGGSVVAVTTAATSRYPARDG
ncbi:SDR family NAD(P)-dependent oxidoreductase, partial [Nocardioides sp.]|uniref:SDR family NAD(P)-dependent oxidoreductase n=1 Tax=Nocardioides sp. TaxID=35761 RepID=UPI0027342ACA